MAPITFTLEEGGDFIHVLDTGVLIGLPDLALLGDDERNQVFEVSFELAELEEETDEPFHLDDVANNFSELGVSTIQMQHDPPDGRVGITQVLGEHFHVFKGFFLLQLAVDNVLLKFFLGLRELFGMEVSEVLDSVLHDIVAESLHGRWERSPVKFEVYQLPSVNWNDPVVWEVLVTNFTHLRLLLEQNIGAEWKHRKNDGCLLAKRNRSVGGLIAVDRDHIVNIVILHRVDQLFDQLAIQLKALEIGTWVLIRDKLLTRVFVVGVAGLLAKRNHEIGVLTGRARHIPNVAGDHSLASDAGNQFVEQQQHHSVVVNAFDEEDAAVVVAEDGVERKLDVLALLNVV